ncbi:DUF4143 domain-containing protein [Raineyella sp. W15-4]|uniref:DUF4143 domain-containing protein n=1 Tax=Raineyella sp. W15-4 TaxID=3081651 RepID=UPI0039890794
MHLIDSGVAARLLRLTSDRLERKVPSVLTQFGHLLETFVVGEVVTQATWAEGVASAGHWRTRDGTEVDRLWQP